ncbi:MAG TPA: NAD-dependent epimerase/dehydratase family protein [Gaiellaceae bacterium]|nr:NAD-dependent epimerase/dehydratase family protein [Gaiellaceae bacterium]
MTRALVTGASGFIGGRLVRRLLDAGTEVHAVARRPREGGGVQWWRADLSDPAAAEGVVRSVRPEVVYHLAGYVSGSRDLAAVAPSVRDTLAAGVNVLVAAARTGCKVVLAGSMEEPAPSGEEPVPGSPYAAAKLALGSYGRMLHALHGLQVVHLRLFMVYGPGQEDREKLVPYVVTSLLRGVPPRLASGERPVDWVYVEDVVDAFLAAAAKDSLAGHTLDIGSGALVTVRALVAEIVTLVGTDVTPEFGALPDRPLETVRAAEIERAKALLDWVPRTPLREGLRSTIEWYRAELIGSQPSAYEASR